MSDDLLQAMAEALANLIVSIDTSDDEDVPPEVASRWFEDTAHTFDQLSASDRRALATLFERVGAQEDDPTRRQAIQEIPESFGLEDE